MAKQSCMAGSDPKPAVIAEIESQGMDSLDQMKSQSHHDSKSQSHHDSDRDHESHESTRARAAVVECSVRTRMYATFA